MRTVETLLAVDYTCWRFRVSSELNGATTAWYLCIHVLKTFQRANYYNSKTEVMTMSHI
jgi:hypothetical protein